MGNFKEKLQRDLKLIESVESKIFISIVLGITFFIFNEEFYSWLSLEYALLVSFVLIVSIFILLYLFSAWLFTD